MNYCVFLYFQISKDKTEYVPGSSMKTQLVFERNFSASIKNAQIGICIATVWMIVETIRMNITAVSIINRFHCIEIKKKLIKSNFLLMFCMNIPKRAVYANCFLVNNHPASVLTILITVVNSECLKTFEQTKKAIEQ